MTVSLDEILAGVQPPIPALLAGIPEEPPPRPSAPEWEVDSTLIAHGVRQIVEPETPVTAQELANLGALDGEFYCRHWFPRTFRQRSAVFHQETWAALESGYRFVSVELFRSAGKTTMLRAFISKRIAYNESRTIQVVGENQDAAKRTLRWIRRQIIVNTRWAQFFQLSLGTKKTDEWLEIYHGVDEEPITLLAVGITGQTRGVNLDDWRPDLIVVDDPCDEENTATPEQRKKIHDLFFGALGKSLAPPIDNENALMCLLQTPLNEADLISECRRDPQWYSLTFGCFTEDGQSRWPERLPTKDLQADKNAHIARNDLPLWLREMECKIVAEGISAFRTGWLKPYPAGMRPKDLVAEGARAYLYIDPVPPPSPQQLAMGLKGKHWEAFAVVLKFKGEIYLAETRKMRGHEPDWTIMTFWELVDEYKITEYGADVVNYQRTIKWILEQSMKTMGRYIPFHVVDKMDKRKKSYRIIDGLKGVCSSGRFHVIHEEHSDFVEQYTSYPAVNDDDVIEAVAEATRMAQESLTLEGVAHHIGENDTKQQAQLGNCP